MPSASGAARVIETPDPSEEVDTEVEEPQAIAFYTRPGCPFSAALFRRLRRRGLPLEVHDIWRDRDAAAFVRSVARGNETVPTVVVGGAAFVNPSARQVLAATAEHAPHLLPEPSTTGATGARRVRAWFRHRTPTEPGSAS
jgi:mycoredoxin